jgi:hypothetical protein
MGGMDPTLTQSAVHKRELLGQTQSKAQELLSNLDLARKQKIGNERLKGMCLDNEELMQKLHRQTHTAKSKQEILRLHKKAGELLRDFEQGINYKQLTKFNVVRYMSGCNQEMGIKELIKPESQPDPLECQKVLQTLRSMRGLGDSAEPFNAVVDFGCKLMEKVLDLLQSSNMNSREWAQVMAPLLVLLKDVMHASPIENCLIGPEEDVKRMKFNIEECSQQQAQAISEGEMKEAEAIYYQKIQMQETASQLIKKKLAVLEEEENNAFKIPLKRVHECHNRANFDISTVLKNHDKVKKRAEQDLHNLVTELEKVNLEDYNATKGFSEEREASNQALKENQQRQEACWTKMEELEQELISLGNFRYEEIKKRAKALERNEKRIVEYQHFLEFVNQHKQLLQLTIKNCELAEEITDTVDEFISSGCNAIERRMRDVEKEIEAKKIEVHEEYLDSFRSMYLTIGDLHYKKERNMEELDKKIQLAHIQQEFAMETFNPKAKEWSQQKKQLNSERKAMEDQIGELRGRANLYIEWFGPTQKALIEAGKDFKHPVEELQETNASRANKLVEYHDLMTRQEDDEAEYAAELAEIERLRALTASQELARLPAPADGPSGTSPTFGSVRGTPHSLSGSMSSSFR